MPSSAARSPRRSAWARAAGPAEASRTTAGGRQKLARPRLPSHRKSRYLRCGAARMRPGGAKDEMSRKIDVEALCADKGLRITEQRRVIARVLSEAEDHPDVEALHARAAAIDPKISIATVYRTVRLFEEAGILDRHDFGDGRSRYEAAPEAHHDHLIDVESGRVVEFVDPELELLQRQIAEKLGFRLVDHRMELYGVRIDRES